MSTDVTTITPEQRQLNDLRSMLLKGQQSIAAAIPKSLSKHLTPERMIQLAVTSVRKNPGLLECPPITIAASLVEASQLGLSVDGVLGEGYLIPRWSKKLGHKVCNFQVGYKGLIALARRTGTVETIDAEAVYEGDHFEYAKGLQDKLEHVSRSAVQSKETMTHVWALIRFKGGAYQFKVMTKAQVESIRKRSTSSEDGPWSTDYAAMAVKTVIRQLMKLCDLSPEAARTVAMDENREIGAVDAGEELPVDMTMSPEKQLPEPKAIEAEVIQQPTATSTADGVAAKLASRRRVTQNPGEPTAAVTP
jgi:recombination protein RecT